MKTLLFIITLLIGIYIGIVYEQTLSEVERAKLLRCIGLEDCRADYNRQSLIDEALGNGQLN